MSTPRAHRSRFEAVVIVALILEIAALAWLSARWS
jgi:hypothetical protein